MRQCYIYSMPTAKPRSHANPITTDAIARTLGGLPPEDAVEAACSGHTVSERARERIVGLCEAVREGAYRAWVARRAETACANGGAS